MLIATSNTIFQLLYTYLVDTLVGNRVEVATSARTLTATEASVTSANLAIISSAATGDAENHIALLVKAVSIRTVVVLIAIFSTIG